MQFSRGKGLIGTPVIFETRARVVNPVPNGLVAAAFSFVTDSEIRSEIDFEILSNEINANGSCVLTNIFKDDNFSQTGNKKSVCIPGLRLTDFNTFQIEWLENQISWFINGELVRKETTGIPEKAMHFHLNFWAPDAGFSEAFDSSLQPVSSPAQNQTFFYQVDYVSIYREPIASFNLSTGKLHLPNIVVTGSTGTFNATLNLVDLSTLEFVLDHVVLTSLPSDTPAIFAFDTGNLHIPSVRVDNGNIYKVNMSLQSGSSPMRFQVMEAEIIP